MTDKITSITIFNSFIFALVKCPYFVPVSQFWIFINFSPSCIVTNSATMSVAGFSYFANGKIMNGFLCLAFCTKFSHNVHVKYLYPDSPAPKRLRENNTV